MSIKGISLREQKLMRQLKGTQNLLDDTVKELNQCKELYDRLQADFALMTQIRLRPEEMRKLFTKALGKRKV